MKIEIRKITPEIAAALLENNPLNRSISVTAVNNMARDMKHGAWQVNGDAIRINGNGDLIDGQHRLTACVQSGVPFDTLVISGLPNDVRDTIDGGRKRSAGDRLAMRGVENYNRTAAAIRALWWLAAGATTTSPTDQEIFRALELHPGIPEIAGQSFPAGMPHRAISAVRYIGEYTGHPATAADFARVWQTGIPTYEGDAAHALRERHLRSRNSASPITHRAMLWLMASAWLKFLERKPVSRTALPKEIRIPGWSLKDLGAK